MKKALQYSSNVMREREKKEVGCLQKKKKGNWSRHFIFQNALPFVEEKFS